MLQMMVLVRVYRSFAEQICRRLIGRPTLCQYRIIEKDAFLIDFTQVNPSGGPSGQNPDSKI